MTTNICQQVNSLQDKIQQICQQIYNNEDKQALAIIAALLDELEQLLHTLEQGRILADEEIVKLNQVLYILLEALETKDYMTIIDQLKYELLEMLNRIQIATRHEGEYDNI